MDLQGWALIFYDSTGRCVGAEGANTDKQDGVGTCPITQFFTKSRSTMVPDTQAGWGTLIIQEEGLLGGADGNGGGGGGNGGGGGRRGMGMGSAAAAVALLDLDGAVSEFLYVSIPISQVLDQSCERKQIHTKKQKQIKRKRKNTKKRVVIYTSELYICYYICIYIISTRAYARMHAHAQPSMCTYIRGCDGGRRGGGGGGAGGDATTWPQTFQQHLRAHYSILSQVVWSERNHGCRRSREGTVF